jgi:hypothetical protein
MDLSDLIPKNDTATFEIKHPLSGEVMVKDDGKPMTITVYLPNSKEYRAVIHAQTNARIQRSQKNKGLYTSEEIEESTLDLLAKTTKGWDIQLDKKEPAFTPEFAKEVFDKLPWVKAQVLQAQEDYDSFFKV